MLFAYIGPETMYLVPSIIAAIAGVFMMFGRNINVFCRRVVRRVWPGPQRKPVPSVSQTVATGVSQTPGESIADKPEAPSAI